METEKGRDLQRRLMLAGMHAPDLDACSRLARNAATLHRLAEDECNGAGTWYGESVESFGLRQAAWERRVERDTMHATVRVEKLAARLGLQVIFQGDPRGAPFALVVNGSEVWVP